MPQSANVHSIDDLKDFKVAFVKFGEEASQALAAVDVEVRRALDWLSHDQLKFWQQEVRRREDLVNEARMELSRCLISKTASGETPSCYDQKKALERAKLRLEEAREKVEKVKYWTRVVEQEVTDYRGPAQQLGNMIDGELPKAYANLQRIIDSLEAYLNVPPELDTGPGLAASAALPAAPPAKVQDQPEEAGEDEPEADEDDETAVQGQGS